MPCLIDQEVRVVQVLITSENNWLKFDQNSPEYHSLIELLKDIGPLNFFEIDPEIDAYGDYWSKQYIGSTKAVGIRRGDLILEKKSFITDPFQEILERLSKVNIKNNIDPEYLIVYFGSIELVDTTFSSSFEEAKYMGEDLSKYKTEFYQASISSYILRINKSKKRFCECLEEGLILKELDPSIKSIFKFRYKTKRLQAGRVAGLKGKISKNTIDYDLSLDFAEEIDQLHEVKSTNENTLIDSNSCTLKKPPISINSNAIEHIIKSKYRKLGVYYDILKYVDDYELEEIHKLISRIKTRSVEDIIQLAHTQKNNRKEYIVCSIANRDGHYNDLYSLFDNEVYLVDFSLDKSINFETENDNLSLLEYLERHDKTKILSIHGVIGLDQLSRNIWKYDREKGSFDLLDSMPSVQTTRAEIEFTDNKELVLIFEPTNMPNRRYLFSSKNADHFRNFGSLFFLLRGGNLTYEECERNSELFNQLPYCERYIAYFSRHSIEEKEFCGSTDIPVLKNLSWILNLKEMSINFIDEYNTEILDESFRDLKLGLEFDDI